MLTSFFSFQGLNSLIFKVGEIIGLMCESKKWLKSIGDFIKREHYNIWIIKGLNYK